MRLISVLIGFLWLWKAAEEERKVCDRLSAALVTHKACFEKASAIAEKLSVSLTFHLEKKIMVRFTIGGTTKQVLGVTIYSACSARIPSKPGPYRMGKFAISITLRQSTLRCVGLFSCSSHSLILEKKNIPFCPGNVFLWSDKVHQHLLFCLEMNSWDPANRSYSCCAHSSPFDKVQYIPRFRNPSLLDHNRLREIWSMMAKICKNKKSSVLSFSVGREIPQTKHKE